MSLSISLCKDVYDYLTKRSIHTRFKIFAVLQQYQHEFMEEYEMAARRMRNTEICA